MALFQLCLVYDWGQYGNITQYLDSHPGASRPSLVSSIPVTTAIKISTHPVFLAHDAQLLDVAKGLEYLHGLDIAHGDLKGVCSL